MTAVINYYEELESYIDEKDKAKTFVVQADVKDGTPVVSSPLPISFLPNMIAAIETVDAAHTALTLWDRKFAQLVLIPHHTITRISIKLG